MPPRESPRVEIDLASPHPGFGTGRDVWLFRHGEVHGDWQGRAYGGLDVPLSPQGEQDSVRIARAFARVGLGAVVSSNLVRARTLGEALARESGAPLSIDAGLAEIQRGRWQGRPMTELFAECEHEVAAFYADPWSWNGHGGETDRDVLERAWPVLERALTGSEAAPSGGSLALTSHYNVIRVLVARALGVAPASSFRLRVDLGGATLLRDGPRGWTLVRANVRSPELAG